MKKIKRLPYGLTDIERIQTENYYYVDKTRFIPVLEETMNYVFLIRPRRFGKSLWLSVLEDYYDVAKKDKFETYFKETYIKDHPTEEQGKYLILSFNFSAVNPNIKETEASFENHCSLKYYEFCENYRHILGDDFFIKIKQYSKSYDTLEFICTYCKLNNLKLFIIIDEYDNFANTILSTPGSGKEQYFKLTHKEGFFRFFFNKLKAGTTGSNAAISKLFITGVSPLTMDDVTSGFNIGENVATDDRFNQMVGFNRQEVISIIKYYQNEGVLHYDTDYLMSVIDTWYNNYKFSKRANTNMYNSDMVLYFLKKIIDTGYLPDSLIDNNAKTDYEKLRYLVILDNKLNGNFSLLKNIYDTGNIISDIQTSFSVSQLHKQESFVSLLYYFGLITIEKESRGKFQLKIPNETIKSFYSQYILQAYRDTDVFNVDIFKLENLVDNMAYDGLWEPVFEFLANEIKNQSSIRDYIRGEAMVKGFLLAYLNISSHYLIHPEYEMNKGYCDLYLEPFFVKHPEMKYSYMIEIKYEKRNEKGLSKTSLDDLKTEADKQLQLYSRDEFIRKTSGNSELKKIRLVYNGWELVYKDEV